MEHHAPGQASAPVGSADPGSAAAAAQPPDIPRPRRSKFSSMPPPGAAPQAQQVSSDHAGVSADSNSTQFAQQPQFGAAAQQAAFASGPAAMQQPEGYGAVPQGPMHQQAQPQQQMWHAHGHALHQSQPQAMAVPATHGHQHGHHGAHDPMGTMPHSQPQQAHAQPQGGQHHPARVQLHPLAQPQQAPPQLVAAPADSALATRITKLAEFTTRNGTAFEEQVRAKQGSNAEYAFLHSGEGSDYYAWCLFCMARQLPLDQPLPEGWQDPLAQSRAHGNSAAAAPPAVPVAALPAEAQSMPQEVATGFRQVLQLLQGTQVCLVQAQCLYCALRVHRLCTKVPV